MKLNTVNVKGAIRAGIYQKVYEYTLTGSTTSITVSSLDGNTDEEYIIFTRFISANAATSLLMRPNNDTGSNYGYQLIYGQSTSVAAVRATATSSFPIGYGDANNIDFGRHLFYAKSGYMRGCTNLTAQRQTGTTVTVANANTMIWNDTSNNVTSITFLSDTASGMATGTYFLILKRVTTSTSVPNFNQVSVPQGKLLGNVFETVYETTLGADASTVSITGLDGDTDIVYELQYRKVQHASSAGSLLLRINNDSGANYGYQTLKGSSTTLSAARASDTKINLNTANDAVNNLSTGRVWLYAKTGYSRSGVVLMGEGITATTVTSCIVQGVTYTNTATNMTSLDLSMSAGQMKTGTYIRLLSLKHST